MNQLLPQSAENLCNPRLRKSWTLNDVEKLIAKTKQPLIRGAGHHGNSFLSFGVVVEPLVGGWKELARTTLGSANNDILVSSFADKRYLMVLTSISGSTGNQNVFHRFNLDAGNNYAERASTNSGSDGSSGSITQYFIGGGGASADSTPDFIVSHIANLSNKEKLEFAHSIQQSTAGAGVPPNRNEAIGKWANTAAAITTLLTTTITSNTYNTGSEVVVLGWDPADVHTDNFWEELSSTTSGGGVTEISSGTITAKKYLWIQGMVLGNVGNVSCRFNNDASSNYARRFSIDGGGDITQIGSSSGSLSSGTTSNTFFNMFIVNVSANEKLVYFHTVEQNTAGAANAPGREEGIFKWVNTSSQITEIDIFTQNNMSSGSILKVWGSN